MLLESLLMLSCPVTMTIASIGIAAASAVASGVAAKQQADQRNAMVKQQRENAIANFASQRATLQERRQQEAQAAASQEVATGREAARQQATALASGAPEGQSTDALIQNYGQQLGFVSADIGNNLDAVFRQLDLEEEAAGAGADQRISTLQRSDPTLAYVGAGLSFVGGAVNATDAYLERTGAYDRARSNKIVDSALDESFAFENQVGSA